MKKLQIEKPFQILDAWIPSRIALAVSVDTSRKPNIIPLGWSMVTSFDPPMVAISVGNCKGQFHRYSCELIANSGEFVLALPGEDLGQAVVYCGTHSGKDVDKFRETGLTPVPSSIVKPPLVKECVANLECRVVGSLDTGDHTIFAGEVVASWASDLNKRYLLSISRKAGYDIIVDETPWLLGAVKEK